MRLFKNMNSMRPLKPEEFNRNMKIIEDAFNETDTWHDCVMGTYTDGTQEGFAKCRKDITGQYLEIYAYLPKWQDPYHNANYLFLLPEGYRPSQKVEIPITALVSIDTFKFGYLTIQPNGEVTVSTPMMMGNSSFSLNPSYQYIKIPLTLPTL